MKKQTIKSWFSCKGASASPPSLTLTPSKGVVAYAPPRTLVMMGILLLAACEVGPDYHAPDVTLPAQWIESKINGEKHTAIEMQWWKQFNDPVLDALIEKALAQNFDLKIAETHIAQARAVITEAKSPLLPEVNAIGTGERQANEVAFGTETLPTPFNVFQTGFDASWELDLFGGHRREFESARAVYKATEATRDDIRISVLAEVGRIYMEIRKYQAQIAVAENLIGNEQDNVRIKEELFTKGQAPETDAITARAGLAQVESQLVSYENSLYKSEYGLDLLLGEKPGYTKDAVAKVQPIDVVDQDIMLLAPAEVIAHRPDIKAADRKFASSVAQVGVAKARLFPDVSLTGFFGYFSTSTNNLIKAQNKAWDIGGSVVWPVFTYGRLSAQVEEAKAQNEEALLNYKKAVTAALIDVESAFSSYNKQEESSKLLQKATQEDEHGVDIANMRYKDGVASLSEVISAKRNLYGVEVLSASATAGAAEDLIAVYKALGGGWEPPVKPAEKPPEKAPEKPPEKPAEKLSPDAPKK